MSPAKSSWLNNIIRLVGAVTVLVLATKLGGGGPIVQITTNAIISPAPLESLTDH